MVDRDINILQRIKGYCVDIESFIERFGKNYDVFINDRAYFNAVSMCILQIGELSGNLSAKFRADTTAKIPWSNIRGMRNIVAHDYGSVDEELVWETATDDIPLLREFCEAELDSLQKNM